MTKSMTAFARVQSNTETGVLTWEVRSVNSRYLDLHMRLPDDFRAREGRYRELISKQLSRGKIECNLRFKPQVITTDGLDVNKDIAKSVVDACQNINNILHQPSAINPIEVLNWPGVVRDTELDLKPLHSASEKLLSEALAEAIALHHRPKHKRALSLPVPQQRALLLVHVANQLVKYCHVYGQNTRIAAIEPDTLQSLGLETNLESVLDRQVKAVISRSIFFAESIMLETKLEPTTAGLWLSWGDRALNQARRHARMQLSGIHKAL